MNMKTTVWAEIWHDGKIEPTPGFPVTQWIIPPRGQGFDGYVTFKLGAAEQGQSRCRVGHQRERSARPMPSI